MAGAYEKQHYGDQDGSPLEAFSSACPMWRMHLCFFRSRCEVRDLKQVERTTETSDTSSFRFSGRRPHEFARFDISTYVAASHDASPVACD